MSVGPAGDRASAAEQERVRRTVRVGNGLGMVVRLATTDLPHYPDAPDEVNAGLVLEDSSLWVIDSSPRWAVLVVG